MKYSEKSLTRDGAKMFALADDQTKAINIDGLVVSEKVITAGTDISTLTLDSFTDYVLFPINSRSQGENQFTVRSVVTNHYKDTTGQNHDITKDFDVSLVGILGHVEGYTDQHIISVAIGDDPFVLPAYQGTPFNLVFGFTTAYSPTQNVTITIDNSAYALATDLDDVKNLQGSIGIAIDSKLKDYAKKDEVQNLIPDDIATTKNVSDGDAATLKSAKDYADTKISGKADDSKVVHDNHDGTEQLNGVQVQPFNKLSDTVGGRNLLTGTSGILQTVTNVTGWLTNLPFYIPMVTTVASDTTYTVRSWIAPASYDMWVQLKWTESSGTLHFGTGNNISAGASGYSTWTGTVPAGSTLQSAQISFTKQQSTNSTVSYKEMKLEKGSIATAWSPAPEDKVNVSDMRKPASDVAGIEEVNAKQDKLDYTPANAANVVDRNPDTGVVSKPTDFTNLTVNGGKSVATRDDLNNYYHASASDDAALAAAKLATVPGIFWFEEV